MMTSQIRISTWCVLLLAACCMASTHRTWAAADAPTSPAERERQLISILQSEAPPQDKAITCKRLAVYGSKEAVPALAPLLLDKELSSWARIALEAIPGPAADEALRNAIPKTQGRLLVGVINSIGVRRDGQAVSALTEKLRDTDPDVAAASAEALGHIGGTDATKALESALAAAPASVRSAVAYGCILSAEQLMTAGKGKEAAALYDRVRQAEVPKQRAMEATRGAILARGSQGLSLLLEQLRSPDNGLFSIGVRTARELPGRDVTDAIATELNQANPDRQVPLVLALADRTDASVLPKVLQAAQTGSKPVRLTALGLLDRYRDLACVPVLLNAAAEPDPELARTAHAALARLGGKDVDADLLARLRLASGKMRQVLIELAGQRRIEGAVPAVLRSMEDADKGTRRAALEAIGLLGSEAQAGDLVRQLSTSQNADDREDVELALMAVCRRNGARCLPRVLPLTQGGNTALRKIGLRALASIGGHEALSAVKSALNDSDESMQDEAVNLLSTWPNTWPEDSEVAEPLLTLAKSGKKTSYQVQGLQGYLQYLEQDKKLTQDEKLARLKDLLAITKTPDAKRQVVAVVGTVPTAAALQMLTDLTADEAVTEEACVTALKLATARNLSGGSKEVRRAALHAVADKTQNESTRTKANEALKRLQ